MVETSDGPDASQTQKHTDGSVRHAEKRRSGTCLFADRIARAALDEYRRVVPAPHRQRHPKACVAAVVAHFPLELPLESDDDDSPKGNVVPSDRNRGLLQVVGLGVGTKFLSEAALREEVALAGSIATEELVGRRYGMVLRDCHAEVLARRAFRRQITMEILEQEQVNLPVKRNIGNAVDSGYEWNSSSYRPIMQKFVPSSEEGLPTSSGISRRQYMLIPGVTLHFYSSSAPCGNATLKKFAKMEKERYDPTLGPDEWPHPVVHEPVGGHSIRLGQFALLVKKDNNVSKSESGTCEDQNVDSSRDTISTLVGGRRGKVLWPANSSDDWCPPGTTIVTKNGSIHTCSDKIARWNCLGLQGSLLASVLANPLYMSTLTIGRKLTACICRRAVCCRASGFGPGSKGKDGKNHNYEDRTSKISLNEKYSLHHPAIMGTAVYMDESGVLEMTGTKVFGQDVRFGTNLCWVWWPEREGDAKVAECVNGITGMVHRYRNDDSKEIEEDKDTNQGYSKVSTAALTDIHVYLSRFMADGISQKDRVTVSSLHELRSLKCFISSEYEAAKENLLKNHRIFRQWSRRERSIKRTACLSE